MTTPTRPVPNISAIPGSPRTPQRGISSTYSSPGFSAQEDIIIFEVGTRHVRTGLAGDSSPRHTVTFGTGQSRRLGDYRQCLPGYDERPRQVKSLNTWTIDHELWQLDTRTFDLALMEDKLERAIRASFAEGLLMDAKSHKAVLVVSAMTSHIVLSRLLNLMFVNFQIASVTLVPPPTMAVVAAGQRSGLIVDIGWHETVITAVYEFREISEYRTRRAMQTLMTEAAKFFESYIESIREDKLDELRTSMDFEYVEELVTQILWCKTSSHDEQASDDTETLIRLPLSSSRPKAIPFSNLNQPVETALFAESLNHREQDDHEKSLSYLLYMALVRLPPDIRAVCMSRITVIGGGSNIPGIKSRLLNDLAETVEKRGWSNVWKPSQMKVASRPRVVDVKPNETGEPPTGPAFQAHDFDKHTERFLTGSAAASAKHAKPQFQGEIRGIESMGPFVGASLTSALGVKSLVEIEKDVFLQHGLQGPRKEEHTRPKSLGGTFARLPTADSSTYTLGAWA